MFGLSDQSHHLITSSSLPSEWTTNPVDSTNHFHDNYVTWGAALDMT
jgi:hypothetical protein